jgi:hypothetical protein
MITQWRAGPGGMIGLDYCALPTVFKIRGIKKKFRQDVFDGLQIMERAVLSDKS